MSDLYYYEYEEDDFYCYPNSYVLKNKFNITDNGYKLDWLKISKEEMLEASLQTFNREYKLMGNLLLRALSGV